MKFDYLTKRRVGMILAFSLALTGTAAYTGVQADGENRVLPGKNTEGLTAGVASALNPGNIEGLNVTAGITDILYDTTYVAVKNNGLDKVGQIGRRV